MVGTVIVEMVDEKNVVVIVLEVEGIMYVIDVVFLVVMVGKNKGLGEDFLPIVVITSPMKVGVSLNIVIIVVLIRNEVCVEVNLIVVVFTVE